MPFAMGATTSTLTVRPCCEVQREVERPRSGVAFLGPIEGSIKPTNAETVRAACDVSQAASRSHVLTASESSG
jgi:hypothetical protein